MDVTHVKALIRRKQYKTSHHAEVEREAEMITTDDTKSAILNRDQSSSQQLFCVNHPFRKTTLRCNKCNKPVCNDCVRLTPVGYRCKQCITQHLFSFNPVHWYDYGIVGTVSAILSAIAGVLIVMPICFAIFLTPFIGRLIADITFRIIRRRRGRYIPWVATGGIVLGGLASFTFPLFLVHIGAVSLKNFMGLLVLLWPVT